jgi:hypothetical protein
MVRPCFERGGDALFCGAQLPLSEQMFVPSCNTTIRLSVEDL